MTATAMVLEELSDVLLAQCPKEPFKYDMVLENGNHVSEIKFKGLKLQEKLLAQTVI